MNNPLVSIIIPVFNRGHLIGETLDSIIGQTYSNWECIVVNDGSTDNTKEVVLSYTKADNRFKYYERPTNRLPGGNAARNYGFEISLGEFIQWFDSDDIMLEEFLKKKILGFSDNVDLIISNYKYSNFKLTRYRERNFNVKATEDLFLLYSLDKVEIQINSCIWRREFLKKRTLFDETLHRYQDNNFNLKMLFEKPEYGIISDILAIVRGGNGDKSQISSNLNQTTKKLKDIFYYRYFALNLVNKYYTNEDKCFEVLCKKTIWAFYEVLKKEMYLKNRITLLLNNFKRLAFVFALSNFSIIEKTKKVIFILRLVCFKK